MKAVMEDACPRCSSPFEQLDYDAGDYIEYGFCGQCKKWFNRDTGELEKDLDHECWEACTVKSEETCRACSGISEWDWYEFE
jgi:hypothetical protein